MGHDVGTDTPEEEAIGIAFAMGADNNQVVSFPVCKADNLGTRVSSNTTS